MTTAEESFLALVRAGIGHPTGDLPERLDWESIVALADDHGLAAILSDALDRLTREGLLSGGRAMPKQQFYDCFGNALYFEQRYSEYGRAIASLSAALAEGGFRTMVLKGYALSLNYPVPAHRPCGDIDIWNFGRYREADAFLASHHGIRIDDSHHHHTVYSWKGFSVENHYDIVNVHSHRSSAVIEKVFKELAMDDGSCIDLDGSRVYLPSADFHALFMLRHSLSHFAATRMILRQLLDWAFFVEKHTGEIGWPWLLAKLEEFHMKDFCDCLCRICVEDLGFPPEIFPFQTAVSDDLKDRVLNDIISPEFQGREPRHLLERVWFKYRRWHANIWKHRLCYREGLVSSFFVSAWSHLLKPSSI